RVTADSAELAVDGAVAGRSAARDARLCGRLPVGDGLRGSPRPVPASSESSSRLPRQAPLLVLLMDAGPRGLGCQTAWVSFQATGGYFFRRNQQLHLVDRILVVKPSPFLLLTIQCETQPR